MRYGPFGELVRGVSRFAVVAVIGGMAAACSADSMRFSETPFSNPFGSNGQSDPGMTGSIDAAAPAPAPRLPRSSVSSAPLSPVAAAPVYNQPTSVAAAPATAPSRSGASGWSVDGGTPITVGSSDSLTTLSDRYGVPAAAILSANGMTARDVSAGRRLVIPVYSATGRAVAQAPAAPPRQAASPQPERRPDVVAPVRPRSAPVAAAPAVEPRVAAAEPKARVRPGREAASATPAAKPVVVAKAPEPAKPAPATGKLVKSEPLAAAKAQPKREAKVAVAPKPAPAAPKVAAVEPAKPAPEPAKVASRDPDSTASVAPAAPSAEFRWPARGRVISGFAGSNEGINIAVPDGTPVKAAEAGTVAYAGSEVKGYGNLVLIRHDNGYVSAYAHNGDIDVKRGQKVSRGQTIAKSGQTGNVTSPQIHFEIRKGSTPVDPMKYLASN